jgi:pimeloyl-ACP methyl ester carboxylesterase
MPKVKVNDIEIYYEIHGEGTPLLLFMGWGGSIEDWPKQFIDLSANNFKTIIFDNRGTGRTSKPKTGYSIKQMADDAAALLKVLEIPKSHVFGISMGGMLAQEYGISYSNNTIGLVLAATHCGSPHNIERTDEAAAIMEKVVDPPEEMSELELMKEFVTLWYTPEYLSERWDELASSQKKMYPTPGWVRRKHWDAIIDFSSYDRLPSIVSPTMVLHGSRDNWVLPGNAKIIADRIPGTKLKMYEKSGHSFAEQADEMFNDIIEFFKSVEET